MLTGLAPSDGESAQSILMKQATANHAPIGDHRDDVPAALVGVVDRMLAKDPGERFQTAEEASRALVAAVPGASGETVRVRGGSPAMAVKALIGLVILAGAALVALTLLGKPPRLAVSTPIPDGVVRALRRRGALATGDVAQFVFAPAGAEDTTFLVVGRHNVAGVTPHRVRSYPPDRAWARDVGDII